MPQLILPATLQSRTSLGLSALLSSLAQNHIHPFCSSDVTAGSETELQVAVIGKRDDIDLSLAIEHSNYFANLRKRAASGETPSRLLSQLEQYLDHAPNEVWENSWVRVPQRLLSPFARRVFRNDLRRSKQEPFKLKRSDSSRFFCVHKSEECLRIPISYLLKLSLAHAVSEGSFAMPATRAIGEQFMAHYLNDNTSPETFSFYVVPLTPANGNGLAIAKETAQRLLLTQLLVLYANVRLGLQKSGQQVVVYFAPHPPIRQKELNTLVPDAFYRELFMNPCLSGWDNGQAKQRYMELCHLVLSRSQLNAVIKLKEAGIITRNLIVLPNTSNISLANNGTHLSLGSRALTRLLQDPHSGFDAAQEKTLGDLVIKIVEHFLPLFVGTYSAAPYRLDFRDFHPERALGFLPHELDFTFLRMLWRRWKKKAGLKIFGQPLTPLGPLWIDQFISSVFHLTGDFVPDFRLIDYLAALMSTDQSPALDGSLGNDLRLKKDLAEKGVFDEQMSLYLFYRLRACSVMGFSGFEGRHYSLFESLRDDFGGAADLQALVTALAIKYIARGMVTHADIPDDPDTESERRQIIFSAAVGVSAFNVRTDTPNHFLQTVLSKTEKIRESHRYQGYLRVKVPAYQRALVSLLLEDGADIIDEFGLGETLTRLQARLEDPDLTAAGKLTSAICKEAGVSSPIKLPAARFNEAAEKYYRGTLRIRHMQEALAFVQEDLQALDRSCAPSDRIYVDMIFKVIGSFSAQHFFLTSSPALLQGTADARTLQQLIHLLLVVIERNRQKCLHALSEDRQDASAPSSIH